MEPQTAGLYGTKAQIPIIAEVKTDIIQAEFSTQMLLLVHRIFFFLMWISFQHLKILLQEEGLLLGQESGLLSNTQKWIVWGDTRTDTARDFIEKGCLGGE